MTDHHVHIGQFNEIYYDALELFELIESTQEKTHLFGKTHSLEEEYISNAKTQLPSS